MNKWQIICPVCAMLLFALSLGFIAMRSNSNEVYLAMASHVAVELVGTTNFDLISPMPPDLKSNLASFLASPARLASLRRDVTDPTHPVICLRNDAGHMMEITLAWQTKTKKFSAIAYTNPPPAPVVAPQ